MTKLSKHRRRNGLSPLENRLLTPWSNNFFRPWENRFFSSDFDTISDLVGYDDIFKDDFFEKGSLMPAMNVIENKKDFEIEFAAPGFDKKDFEVTIEDDVLHVSGEKEVKEDKKEDDYSRKEFSYKSFKRSLLLPDSVDLEQDVKASYKNGILKVKLLKQTEVTKEEVPKKVIDVN